MKKECPGVKEIENCDTIEEAVRDSDIIIMTTTAGTKEAEYPYINGEWVKKGAFICMPSAGRFDESFLTGQCRLVVDNYKLYEAWAEEFPYPSYELVGIIGIQVYRSAPRRENTKRRHYRYRGYYSRKTSGTAVRR